MKKKLLVILLSLLTLIFASNPTIVILAESYSDSTVESVDTSLNYSISAPRDNQGNIYADGTLAKTADKISNTNTVVEKQYSTRAITNWHYLQ